MAPSSSRIPTALPSSIRNKHKRQEVRLKQKKAQENSKRDERFRRKREENKNPQLRAERLARNKTKTLDNKRVWDEFVGEDGDNMLGLSVDLVALSKRRKVALEEEQPAVEQEREQAEDEAQWDDEDEENVIDQEVEDAEGEDQPGESPQDDQDEDDLDSMLESSDSEDNEGNESAASKKTDPLSRLRHPSPTVSTTSSTLAITPESLAAKFPTLFVQPAPDPKILITTSFTSALHKQAQLLTSLFPNSVYVPRQAHHHSHKFSIRDIARFAARRSYTAVVVLNETQKQPTGLDIVHLPAGPMFHFSLTSWVDGKRLPGHGNPTGHVPELVLNGFKTPLGVLTAHLFRTLFPPRPQLAGRQVVTLHNSRDFVFLRRHRYVFRAKRPSEKPVQAADGKPFAGLEDLKAGLQELGPRFTLKLRRIDRGIQRASGQEWEWKTKTDKVRTKFQM